MKNDGLERRSFPSGGSPVSPLGARPCGLAPYASNEVSRDRTKTQPPHLRSYSNSPLLEDDNLED